MNHVGIDVHKMASQICVIAEGRVESLKSRVPRTGGYPLRFTRLRCVVTQEDAPGGRGPAQRREDVMDFGKLRHG
jgi:hypothetical protein